METQKNRGKDQDLRKDSFSQSKQDANSKRTPEASNKKASDSKSQGLREDRESQTDRDSARKPAADKQPRK